MKLITGGRKYTRIPIPCFFIFVNPHSLGTWVDSNLDTSVRSSAKAYTDALTILTERQERAVEHGLPIARFVTLHGANHFVFLSNEAEVLRYMSAFLAELR